MDAETIVIPQPEVQIPTEQIAEAVAEAITEEVDECEILLSAMRENQAVILPVLQSIASNLESLSNRLPSNLTELIQSQQQMIASQGAEMLATARTLLTPVQQQPEPITETQPENVAVEDPVEAEREVVSEPIRRKRRMI